MCMRKLRVIYEQSQVCRYAFRTKYCYARSSGDLSGRQVTQRMEQWYTLYTKPNAEYQVEASLQKRGIQTYLPEIGSQGTGHERARKPFFPCYLFIKVDLKTVGISQVQWTPGLRRVITFDDRPVPMPDEVVERIRHKLEGMNATVGRPGDTFQLGETVRITRGPLQGMPAIFDGPSTPAERVRVLLAFLGHASRAYVSVTDLESAPPETQEPVPKPPRRTRGRGRRLKNS
jgi:transcriptional antiterminator RfaH